MRRRRRGAAVPRRAAPPARPRSVTPDSSSPLSRPAARESPAPTVSTTVDARRAPVQHRVAGAGDPQRGAAVGDEHDRRPALGPGAGGGVEGVGAGGRPVRARRRSSALTFTMSAWARRRPSRSRTISVGVAERPADGAVGEHGADVGVDADQGAAAREALDEPGDGLAAGRGPARDGSDVQDRRRRRAGPARSRRPSTASRRPRGRGSRSRRSRRRARPTTARLTGSEASTNPPGSTPESSACRRRCGASGPVPSRASSRTGAPSRPAATATFSAFPPGRATYCGAVPSGPAPAPGTGIRSTTSSPRTLSIGSPVGTAEP